jgi:thioredoxin-related protein
MKTILAVIGMLALISPAAALELGDDGLPVADWINETFNDLNEDLADANSEDKRLAIIFEQRGCVYCKKMHEEVFSQPRIVDYIEENYFFVRLNLHGDTEVTDFDGDIRTEKAMARKWGLLFTPTILFMPESVDRTKSAPQVAVAAMPGAFSGGTTLDLLTWVNEKRYELTGDEDFQRYHARRIRERNDGKTD